MIEKEEEKENNPETKNNEAGEEQSFTHLGIQPRINSSTKYIDDDLLETGRESYNQVL